MKKNVYMGGAHKGAKAATKAALSRGAASRFESVVISDPKEKRAELLALDWRRAGIRSEAYEEPCEIAIQKVDQHFDVAFLAIDTIIPMKEVMEKSKIPAQWQLMVRGLGFAAPLLGIAGTVPYGDNEIRESSKLLIGTLGKFIVPKSSMAIRENLLNADLLYDLRRNVSTHSVARLDMMDRDPEDVPGGNLSLFWNDEEFSLIIEEESPSLELCERKKQVLETKIPDHFGCVQSFAVALVSPQNADFFIVDHISSRKRFVRLYMPLVHALPSPNSELSLMAADVTD